jgi:glutaredoxin-like protein
MSYKLANKVPDMTLKARKNGEWIEFGTRELFANKKVIVFGLPGAFTPTCSSTHLPRYQELAGVFAKEGVDHIICVSVNDPFVMDAWQKDQSAGDILFLPDGNAEFTEAIGMLTDKASLNFGKRSWRYSMLVNDMNIEKGFVEADVDGDPFEVSDADTMLKHINPNASLPDVVTVFTKSGCSYCQKAKELLGSKGLSYEEIELGHGASLSALANVTGKATTPQIFINQQHVGGYEELEKHLA